LGMKPFMSIRNPIVLLAIMFFVLSVPFGMARQDVCHEGTTSCDFLKDSTTFKTNLSSHKCCMSDFCRNGDTGKGEALKAACLCKRFQKVKYFSRFLSPSVYSNSLTGQSQNNWGFNSDASVHSSLPIYKKTLSIRC
jgi:hypothetical protein